MSNFEDQAIADQCAKLREEATALDAQVRGIKPIHLRTWRAQEQQRSAA